MSDMTLLPTGGGFGGEAGAAVLAVLLVACNARTEINA